MLTHILLAELYWLNLTKQYIVIWQNAKDMLNDIIKYVLVNKDDFT